MGADAGRCVGSKPRIQRGPGVDSLGVIWSFVSMCVRAGGRDRRLGGGMNWGAESHCSSCPLSVRGWVV